jgi:hypothetical protein
MLRAPTVSGPHATRRSMAVCTWLFCGVLASVSSRAAAHGISEASRETMSAGSILDFIWLGAEHMVTGYDHLLFLFGVVFFLTGFRDVLRFITAFTLGHCITLLGATLAGVSANAYLIDAVIALSVIYKGFENLDGFKKVLGIRAPNLLAMVFIFGLIHGLGLSTRLQELGLGHEGIVSRILAFNLGVELGQIAALSLMLGLAAAWRSSRAAERAGRVANAALILAGAGLFVFQLTGYFGIQVEDDAHHHEAVPPASPTVELPAEPTPAIDAPPAAEQEKDKDQEAHRHGHGHGPKIKKSSPKKPKRGHRHGTGKKHSH